MRLEHFCMTHLLQVMPFLTSKFFFWHIVMFLPVWVGQSCNAPKLGHARRLRRFNREITPNDEYLSKFLPDRKVLLMTFEKLFEIFIKLPMFDCSRARFVMLRGRNQLLVPSGSGKARKTSKIPLESFLRSHRIDHRKDLRKVH